MRKKRLTATALAAIMVITILIVPVPASAANNEKQLTGFIKPQLIELTKEPAGGLRNYSHRVKADTSRDYSQYSSDYFYNKLNDNEKNLYRNLTASAQEIMDSNVTTDRISGSYTGLLTDDVGVVAQLWMKTEAQYFYISNGYGISYRGNSGTAYISIDNRYQNGEDRAEAKDIFFSNVDKILSQAQSGTTLVEKEQIVHDALAKRLTWDDTDSGDKQSAASSLIENNTVCAGYVAAFSILMNALGAPTITVTSDTHAWNVIYLSGQWYNVDVTWDNPTVGINNDMPDGSNITYNYFNASDTTLRNANTAHFPRTLWNTVGIPECYADGRTGISGGSQDISREKTRVELIIPPNELTYGDFVSEEMLSGCRAVTADGTEVPGTFSYADSQVIYTVLQAGTQDVGVQFTPDDETKYSSAVATMSLNVKLREVTVRVNDKTIHEGEPLPQFDYTIVSGSFAGPDMIFANMQFTTNAPEYPTLCTYAITGSANSNLPNVKNYQITFINGTLTVLPKEETNSVEEETTDDTNYDELKDEAYVSTRSLTVKRGRTRKIAAVKNETVQKITYSSSKRRIARVSSNGKVRGLKKGTATVKAVVRFTDGTSRTYRIRVRVR